MEKEIKKIVSWRTTSNFVANKGKTFVEGRIHFALGSTKEEVADKTRKYLESCGYTNIEITDCHVETDDEKYGRPLPRLPSYEKELEGTDKPKLTKLIKEVEDSGDLF